MGGKNAQSVNVCVLYKQSVGSKFVGGRKDVQI